MASFENEHFPLAQKEEVAEDLTVAKSVQAKKVVTADKAVAADKVAVEVAKLELEGMTAEMRETAAIRQFIGRTDTFWRVAMSPNPDRSREWLEEVAADPREYCRKMSAQHQYVLTKLAEFCLHRKL